jgi:hypothetical protein
VGYALLVFGVLRSGEWDDQAATGWPRPGGAALSRSFPTTIENNDAIPSRVKSEAEVKLADGVPFISDADLDEALKEANVPARARDDAVRAYQESRITGLKSALAIFALMDLVALFLTGHIPKMQPGSAEAASGVAPARAATG